MPKITLTPPPVNFRYGPNRFTSRHRKPRKNTRPMTTITNPDYLSPNQKAWYWEHYHPLANNLQKIHGLSYNQSVLVCLAAAQIANDDSHPDEAHEPTERKPGP